MDHSSPLSFTSWFLGQTESLNPAVPQQNQEAFAPSAINQYQANPAPFQSTVPNMAMNLAVAKSNIPGNTQVSFIIT